MKVLICGSRNWDDAGIVRAVVRGLADELEAAGDFADLDIIEGGAKGADLAALHAAQSLGLEVREFRANWAEHGKAAGILRNQQMLDEGAPDMVWAFTDNLATSRGTADMVRRARKAGLPVYVVSRPA